jgi:cellulose synthase operon protein YhjQ
MEQAIAVEWRRFLRDLESRRGDGLESNSGPAKAAGQARGAKQTAWQRLQDAIAITPSPELPADINPPPLPAELAPDQPETARADSAFLGQFTRTPAEEQEHPDSQQTAASEPSRETIEFPADAVGDGARLQEPQVPVPSSAVDDVPQPQPELALEEMPIEAVLEKMSALTSTPCKLVVDTTAPPEPQDDRSCDGIPVEQPTWMPDTDPEEEIWNSPDPHATVTTAPFNGGKTVPGSNDQEGQRWFVLNGVLGDARSPQESTADAPAESIPVLEVFSLSGGVGKTSLVATLGRALSARGERVLLVEATPFGSLPYFFGARDSRPGVLRTFRPPSSSIDAPIRLVSIDPDSLMDDPAAQGSLAAEIQEWSQGVSRILVDVSTASTATVQGLSRMSPLVLVPLIPDVNSVLAANAIDSYFERQMDREGGQPDVYYVLNQFDSSLPLHLDVRRLLEERLGERLLPIALQRTPAVSEALAEGMTIMDYAPDSATADQIISLAKWLEDVMAPADLNSRGRWCEQ